MKRHPEGNLRKSGADDTNVSLPGVGDVRYPKRLGNLLFFSSFDRDSGCMAHKIARRYFKA